MKYALLCLLLGFSALGYEFTKEDNERIDRDGKKFAREIRDDIQNGRMNAMAAKADMIIKHLVEMGTTELKKAGDVDSAYIFEFRYRTEFDGYLTRMVNSERDIGDHSGLSEFLTTYYMRLEFILGVEFCKSTHLSDIFSLNHALPVVFRPCTFPMDLITIARIDEYRNHFNEGKTYFGFFPIIVYHSANVGCMAVSSGAATFLCGPIAGVAEVISARFIGYKLSDGLFNSFCN